MECERCGRPAVFGLTEQGHRSWYCAQCLERASGVKRLGAVLSAFLRKPERLDACPYCGCRDTEWRNSGVMGCPLCYEVFQNELRVHFHLPA